MARSRAQIVPRGLDWQEPQPVPSYSPGWVWQLSGLRWFRPPTRSTDQESGTEAARWAGLQKRDGPELQPQWQRVRGGGRCTSREAERSWAESLATWSDLPPPSQGLEKVDSAVNPDQEYGGKDQYEEGVGVSEAPRERCRCRPQHRRARGGRGVLQTLLGVERGPAELREHYSPAPSPSPHPCCRASPSSLAGSFVPAPRPPLRGSGPASSAPAIGLPCRR